VAEPSTVTEGAVHLSVPASTANLRVVRLVAASLATDLGFGVDEIEDVRVAVDELAALLLESSPGAGDGPEGRRLDLDLGSDGGVLEVQGSCEAPADGEPELHGVAAELLSLLVDEYEVGSGAGRWWFRLRRAHRVDDDAE
jgi:serine/threonine-protein kinase RsbW